MKPTIIHASPTWLPLTQNWMYFQYMGISEEIFRKYVVTRNTLNLSEFPTTNLRYMVGDSLVSKFLYRTKYRILRRSYQDFLGRSISDLNASIVHSHFGHNGVKNMTTISGKAKHIVTFYGADITQVPRSDPRFYSHYKSMFVACHKILCEGEFMADRVIKDLGCPAKKVEVKRLGIDLKKYPFVSRVWDGSEPLRILICGTFREKKGIPYAIEALGRLYAKTDIRITILGDATRKPGDILEKKKIITAVKRNMLGKVTEFKGFCSHESIIEQAYRHHIFLSPSITASDGDNEGGVPVTIIEMAATGMPIVSSLHCDIPAVIKNGITGWLSPEKDVTSIYQNLLWLIDNPSSWSNYLIRSRKHIEDKYSHSACSDHLDQIYLSVLNA